MRKIVTAILLALIATTTVQAENKGLERERQQFIQYADTVVTTLTKRIEIYDGLAESETEPIDQLMIESVGTDDFWAETTPPATREAVEKLVRRYSESFAEVTAIEVRGEVIARPDYGDNWLPITEMAVYCACDYPRVVDAKAGTIRVIYTDPGTIEVLTLDAAKPAATLDSLAFRIERSDDELLRLVVENTTQDGGGISRRRFIEAVAVKADGGKSSFPDTEYRHSQLGRMIGELKSGLSEWEEARRQAAGADAEQLQQLQEKFNRDYKRTGDFGHLGTKYDRIVREYAGKNDRMEIYYRTEPMQKELILTKKFFEDEY